MQPRRVPPASTGGRRSFSPLEADRGRRGASPGAGGPRPQAQASQSGQPQGSRGASPGARGPAAPAVWSPAAGDAVNVFASLPAIARQQGLDELSPAAENITAVELLEIQKLHRPPEVVKRVLEATVLLLDAKRSSRRRSLSWEAVRARITDDSFIDDMLSFDVADLVAAPGLVRFVIMTYFKPKDKEVLSCSRVQYANQAASTLWKWCGKLVLQASRELESQPPAPLDDEPAPPESESEIEEEEVAVEEPPPGVEPEEVEEEELPPVDEPSPPPSPPPEPAPRAAPSAPEPPLQPPSRPASHAPPPEYVPPPPPPRPPSPTPSEIAEANLPLTEGERWHLEFRQQASLCPDGWPQDSDCVVCLMYAHFEFRREAGVCPEGAERDEDCRTCSMFMGLTRMFRGVQITGLHKVRESM